MPCLFSLNVPLARHSQHDGKGPSTTAERKEFSAAVLKQKRNSDEENFDEAVTYFRRAGTKHGVSVLLDLSCSALRRSGS